MGDSTMEISKTERVKLLKKRNKSYQQSLRKRAEWQAKKREMGLLDPEEDDSIETAGNADHDLDALPSLMFD